VELVEAAYIYLTASEVDAQIWAEEGLERAIQRLISLSNDLIADGRSSLYVLNSSDSQYIQALVSLKAVLMIPMRSKPNDAGVLHTG